MSSAKIKTTLGEDAAEAEVRLATSREQSASLVFIAISS
jgi:hypothetical protein